MALKHLVDLDLGGNEIQNVVLQNLGTAPTGVEGQIFYDTAANCVKVHTGSGFVRVGLTADGSTITETNGTIAVGSIAISKVTGLQTALDNKVDDSQVLTNVPANAVFTDTNTQRSDGEIRDVVSTQIVGQGLVSAAIDGENLVITTSATNTQEPAINRGGGTPTLATGVTGAEIRSLIGAGTSSFNGTYGALTGVPSTFAPSAHTHAISEVDGLQDALDTKLDATGLAGYATETYVNTAVSNVIDAAPGALDTLNELAAAIGDDANFSTTITNSIATKLNSADYTAADVLAKIKTVDGAGSGLDADLLDGQSSAYYRNYTNLTNTPTIPIHFSIAVTGEAAPIAVPLGSINSIATVQVYDAGGNLVMTEIDQSTAGTAVINLPDGQNFTIVAVGRA